VVRKASLKKKGGGQGHWEDVKKDIRFGVRTPEKKILTRKGVKKKGGNGGAEGWVSTNTKEGFRGGPMPKEL